MLYTKDFTLRSMTKMMAAGISAVALSVSLIAVPQVVAEELPSGNVECTYKATEGSFNWGIRDQYRRYITTMAHGSFEHKDLPFSVAADESGDIDYTVAGAYWKFAPKGEITNSGDKITVPLKGTLNIKGHDRGQGPVLKSDYSNFALVIDSDRTTAKLVADYVGNAGKGEEMPGSMEDVVSIEGRGPLASFTFNTPLDVESEGEINFTGKATNVSDPAAKLWHAGLGNTPTFVLSNPSGTMTITKHCETVSDPTETSAPTTTATPTSTTATTTTSTPSEQPGGQTQGGLGGGIIMIVLALLGVLGAVGAVMMGMVPGMAAMF